MSNSTEYLRLVADSGAKGWIPKLSEPGREAIVNAADELDRLRAIPDLRKQFIALFCGWTVRQQSLYDEEGIEGWVWTSPRGAEYAVIGDWDELPPWPEDDTATAALENRCREMGLKL